MKRIAPFLLAAAAALAGGGSATSSVSTPSTLLETSGPYRGVGTGLVDRYRHLERGRAVTDSKDVYRVRFTYSFRIRNGRVIGAGTGVYLAATWNLSGTNDGRAFSCNIPLSTTPFAVAVAGSAQGSAVDLKFDISGAREMNADYDCGSGYTGFATSSTYVDESLALVQADRGGSIRISRANPSIQPLRKLVTSGDASDRRVHLHEWAITIDAPATPPPPPPPGGGSGTPKGSGPCTITGTAGDDVLAGTPRRDVICGLGGDDVIRGNGGDDALRGGAGDDQLAGGAGNDAVEGGPGADRVLGDRGRDLLLTRDRARDEVDGGAGRDTGVVDRALDRVARTELLR